MWIESFFLVKVGNFNTSHSTAEEEIIILSALLIEAGANKYLLLTRGMDVDCTLSRPQKKYGVLKF